MRYRRSERAWSTFMWVMTRDLIASAEGGPRAVGVGVGEVVGGFGGEVAVAMFRRQV